MASTTIVNDDSITTVSDGADDFPTHRFSWTAIFVGALVATAVTFFLLALGSGFGLSLVSVRHATQDTAVTFLTLGAIYFFAAQAFGFAAGGHIAGRLIGPLPETRKEAEFLSGAHGLAVWALAVVATATMIYLAALAAGTAAVGGASLGTSSGSPSDTLTPAQTGYWVDRLFRGQPEATHASLGLRKYAQADTGTATDATPSDEPSQSGGDVLSPSSTPAPTTAPAVTSNAAPHGDMLSPGSQNVNPGPSITEVPSAVPPSGPRNIMADKAEAGRILDVGMINGGKLSDVDRIQLATLVAADTGMNEDAAERRVENVEQQIRDSETKAAETARKLAAYASLWTALALLFGGLVCVMSAVAARLEDDRVTFGLPARS